MQHDEQIAIDNAHLHELENRLEQVEGGAVHEHHFSQLVKSAFVKEDVRRWLRASEKRESIQLIIDLLLAVLLGSLVFSAVVFLLVRQSVVQPLRDFKRTIERRHPDRADIAAPEFETLEMQELVDAVERACAAHAARP